MALVPHKIVALNELNEGAKNTIAGAVVSLFDTEGNAVTLFDDESGSNGSTTKQTDSEGVVVVYVTPGEYDEQVNGGIQRRVLVGNKEITTEQLIERIRKTREGDVITTTGFSVAGDAGGAQWKATNTTGLTPSQSPADRGAAELVDGSGRLWVLVSIAGTAKKEISIYALGAAGGTNCGDIIQAAMNSADGGAIVGGGDEFIIDRELITNSSLTIYGKGATFRASDSLGNNFKLIRFFSPSMPNRVVSGGIYDVNFKGNSVAPERWLQTSSGATVSDPESDYVAGSGALASGITGVNLTATLDGDYVDGVTINNGGSGWNGHPTHPYQPDTVQLNFNGDGFGARGYATISGGTLTSVTIESGGYGYTTPPTVTTKGGYADVSLLVEPSVDRRNPNYAEFSVLVELSGCYDFNIEGCEFKEHRGRCIDELGGLNVTIKGNHFENVGKNDGPFHAIYVQSFGTPGAGQSFYSPSENTKVLNNTAKSLERSFALFAPTAGGELSGNRVDGWGESCVFINNVINMDGGVSVFKNNVFKNGIVTDIVCAGFEPNGGRNIDIINNYVTSSQDAVVNFAGLQDSSLKGNRFINCYENHGIPYGPFSERFSFNSGLPPIAGNEKSAKDGALVSVGNFLNVGCKNTEIKGNHFIDNREESVGSIFKQVKNGAGSNSDTCVIEENYINFQNEYKMLDTSVPGVWLPTMPIFMKNNYGHASESAVFIQKTISATGLIDIEVGFRPSKVEVYGVVANNSLGRISIGAFSWSRDGARNDFSLSYASLNDDANARITTNEAIRMIDQSGATVLSAEFVKWVENGFQINTVSLSNSSSVIFVCHP